MEKKDINFIPKGKSEIFHVSQGDNGRVIRCNIYEDSELKKIYATDNVRVRYRKADKTIGSFDVSHSGTKTRVDITIPETAISVSGLTYCKLRINGIACKSFYIAVEERP